MRSTLVIFGLVGQALLVKVDAKQILAEIGHPEHPEHPESVFLAEKNEGAETVTVAAPEAAAAALQVQEKEQEKELEQENEQEQEKEAEKEADADTSSQVQVDSFTVEFLQLSSFVSF